MERLENTLRQHDSSKKICLTWSYVYEYFEKDLTKMNYLSKLSFCMQMHRACYQPTLNFEKVLDYLYEIEEKKHPTLLSKVQKTKK